MNYHTRGDIKPSECGSGGLYSDIPVSANEGARVANRLEMFEMWLNGKDMWDKNLEIMKRLSKVRREEASESSCSNSSSI